MKERLEKFLKLEGLTSVKFAEIMEVQPSNISHILSGRNNPSFDFISRLLLRFSDLNPEWVINGVGEVYKSKLREFSPRDTKVNLFSVPAHNEQNNAIKDDQNDSLKENEGLVTNVNKPIDSLIVESTDNISSNNVRGVKKIILLYNDDSYDILEK